MEKNTTGRFLSTLRKAKGMTQRELAELLNVSDKAVSRWERDESMPDILLLPVLADIFEVTCDELLRGERIVKETYQESSDKQIQRIRALIKKSKSKFQAFSMISVGVALLGVLIAIVLNFSYKKATIGFFCAVIGIIAGVITQVAFYFYYNGDVDTETFNGQEFILYKKYIRDHSIHIFCFLGTMLCICLPLLIFGQVSYADYISSISEQMAPLGYEFNSSTTEGNVFAAGTIAVGLQPKTWLLYGGAGGLIGAVVSFIIIFVIQIQDVKKRRFNVSVQDIQYTKKKIVQFLKYSMILVSLIAATYAGSKVFEEKMPDYFKEGTQFDNFEDFKEHMESIPEGMYAGVIGLRQQLDKYRGTVYGDNGELLCEYRIMNDTVVDVEFGNSNKLPITTYTEEDLAIAKEKTASLMWIWTAMMVAECFIMIGLYIRKILKIYELYKCPNMDISN